MNVLFSILSVAYIAGIFLFADSPIVSDVVAFNPYSLLHIPLYGILTFLLFLSILPYKHGITNPTNSMHPKNSTNPRNLSREIRPAPRSVLTTTSGSLFHWDPMNYFVAGIIAFLVVIGDEVHQAYIPNRNASIIDVFVDMIGIILCVAIIHQLESKSRFSNIMMLIHRMAQKKAQRLI